MINKICIVISNRFMYACEIIDVPTDVWVEEVVEVFVEVFGINVWADSAVDTLSDV